MNIKCMDSFYVIRIVLLLSFLLSSSFVMAQSSDSKIYDVNVTEARPGTELDRACSMYKFRSSEAIHLLIKGSFRYRDLDLYRDEGEDGHGFIGAAYHSNKKGIGEIDLVHLTFSVFDTADVFKGEWTIAPSSWAREAFIKFEGDYNNGVVYFEACKHNTIPMSRYESFDDYESDYFKFDIREPGPRVEGPASALGFRRSGLVKSEIEKSAEFEWDEAGESDELVYDCLRGRETIEVTGLLYPVTPTQFNKDYHNDGTYIGSPPSNVNPTEIIDIQSNLYITEEGKEVVGVWFTIYELDNKTHGTLWALGTSMIENPNPAAQVMGENLFVPGDTYGVPSSEFECFVVPDENDLEVRDNVMSDLEKFNPEDFDHDGKVYIRINR